MPPAEHRSSSNNAIDRLVALMATLRNECPWDRVQTHGSLRRHLLEEAYEVLEALDELEAGISSQAAIPEGLLDELYDNLREELGDLLFQVVFHSHLAAEVDRFELSDVVDDVHDKLVARHPSIFDPDSPASDQPGWEQAKLAEKGRSSVMDGIPAALPALALAGKAISKANSVDASIIDEFQDVAATSAEGELAHELLSLVRKARSGGIDAEAALRSMTGELEELIRGREAQLGL